MRSVREKRCGHQTVCGDISCGNNSFVQAVGGSTMARPVNTLLLCCKVPAQPTECIVSKFIAVLITALAALETGYEAEC